MKSENNPQTLKNTFYRIQLYLNIITGFKAVLLFQIFRLENYFFLSVTESSIISHILIGCYIFFKVSRLKSF